MKMSKTMKPLIIIGATTAVLVFADIMVSKIESGEIKVPDKYESLISDTNGLVKDISKRIIVNVVDTMFS